MNIVLTPQLLSFLSQQGYKCCLSKTNMVKSNLTNIFVYLKPVYSAPLGIRLLEGYDEYYMINEEPVALAEGVEGLLAIITLDKNTLLDYLSTRVGSVNRKEQNE